MMVMVMMEGRGGNGDDGGDGGGVGEGGDTRWMSGETMMQAPKEEN